MAKSKAISPELRGVFDKIEKQADEYNNAFNELNKFFRDSDRIKRENENLIVKSSELFEKNAELCNRLENIDEYVNERMDNAISEVIKYFENIIVALISDKANEAVDNFQIKADEMIEMVEGTTGLVGIVQKFRAILTDFNNKIQEMNSSIATIDDLKKEYEKYKQKIDGSIDKTSKSMKKIRLEVNEVFDTANYNSEEKLKKILADYKENQRIMNRTIADIEKKLNKLTINNAASSQISTGSIEKLISTISVRIDELNSKLLTRIEKLEEKIKINS